MHNCHSLYCWVVFFFLPPSRTWEIGVEVFKHTETKGKPHTSRYTDTQNKQQGKAKSLPFQITWLFQLSLITDTGMTPTITVLIHRPKDHVIWTREFQIWRKGPAISLSQFGFLRSSFKSPRNWLTSRIQVSWSNVDYKCKLLLG